MIYIAIIYGVIHFLCLSDSIIFNENLTLPYPFVTPNNINMLGYQVIGTIISNATAITSNQLYTLSTIFLPHGVWNIFGQVGIDALPLVPHLLQ